MTIRRFLRTLLLVCMAAARPSLQAQIADDAAGRATVADSLRPVIADSLAAAEVEDAGLSLFAPVPLRPLGICAPGLDGLHPRWGGLYGETWRLHEGFNAQFSLSTTFGVGRHSPRGAGFGQSAAFAYARLLTERLTVAAAIYGQNMDWGNYHLHDVGVGAVIACRVTDRMNLYGYVTHSFTARDNLRRPGLLYSPFDDFARTRVGAMAEWKIGESATIGVSVEHTRY